MHSSILHIPGRRGQVGVGLCSPGMRDGMRGKSPKLCQEKGRVGIRGIYPLKGQSGALRVLVELSEIVWMWHLGTRVRGDTVVHDRP